MNADRRWAREIPVLLRSVGAAGHGHGQGGEHSAQAAAAAAEFGGRLRQAVPQPLPGHLHQSRLDMGRMVVLARSGLQPRSGFAAPAPDGPDFPGR